MGRTVSVKLLADVAGYMSGMGRAAVATKELGSEINRAATGGKVENLTRATAGLGLGLAGAAATAVKFSMDFEKSMSAVSAATHAGAKDLDALRQAAIQAGKDTQFSATEAADGVTELAKAGVTTADILGGGLKGALDLAAAGQLGVAEAAETSASAMTQFKLSGDQVPHVADLLAAAAGKAQGSVHDMGAALNQSGLVAAQFGLSIEDTTGVLAEFAHAGLLGSDSGTSFKTMLLAMANPSGVTADRMKELNIQFYDAHGKFIGLAGVADVLQKRLGNLTEQERNAALGQIFGNDAIRAASILYKDGAKGVQDWTKAVDANGYAADTAAKLTDNLAGDLERLKGSLETLAIQSGGGASEGLRKLAKSANGAVDAFSDLPGWIQQTVTMMSGIGGVGLLAAAGFLKARGTAKDFLDELREMGPRGTAAATGISRVAGVAGKLSLVGVAAVGVYEGFKLFSDWAEKRTAPTKANIDLLTDSIKEFAQTGKATGELASKYGDNLQKIALDVQGVTDGMRALVQVQQEVDPQLGLIGFDPGKDLIDPQSVQRIRDLDTALTGLVKNGGASQAAIFMRQLEQTGGLTAEQFAKLTTMLPNYTSAADAANVANGGLAKGFGSAEANAATMRNELDSAIESGQKLTDVWNQLNGAILSSDKTQLAAKQAIDDVKKSFDENGKSIDESGLRYDKHGKAVKQSTDEVRKNSEAALKNRIAVGEAAKKAVEAAQSVYEETGSVKEANKAYTAHIAQLRNVLLGLGLDKTAVDKLIATYAKMPDDVTTKVGITGDKGVGQRLDRLRELQEQLKAGKNISVANAMSKKGFGYGDGGWTGPGAASDEAGIVHADEFVIRKGSRRKLEAQHPGLLDAMNLFGSIPEEVADATPGYASGGRVRWPFTTTAAMTRIPTEKEVRAVIVPPIPSSGMTYRAMEAAIRNAFPGLHVISDLRPGAVTLSGNRSYHAIGRAVDYPPSLPLAEWINLKYKSRTKELITPWNNLNIHNGARHTYTGAVWNQHNFAGGNAHDHWAMAHGGTITEPIFGVGASGRTYSFGENYQAERVSPTWQGGGAGMTVTIYLTAQLAAGSNPSEHGRRIAQYLEQHFARGGEIRVNGRTLVGN